MLFPIVERGGFFSPIDNKALAGRGSWKSLVVPGSSSAAARGPQTSASDFPCQSRSAPPHPHCRISPTSCPRGPNPPPPQGLTPTSCLILSHAFRVIHVSGFTFGQFSGHSVTFGNDLLLVMTCIHTSTEYGVTFLVVMTIVVECSRDSSGHPQHGCMDANTGFSAQVEPPLTAIQPYPHWEVPLIIIVGSFKCFKPTSE